MPGAGLFVVDNDRAAAVYDLDSVGSARYASGMNTPWRLFLAPLGLALVGTIGCSSSRGFCEAHADCEREFIGIVIPDQAGNEPDDVAVCMANNDGFVASLRANEEPECQEVAEKYEIYMACIGNEFANNDDGCEVLDEDCDDELDDYQDALNDVDGNECSAGEG